MQDLDHQQSTVYGSKNLLGLSWLLEDVGTSEFAELRQNVEGDLSLCRLHVSFPKHRDAVVGWCAL